MKHSEENADLNSAGLRQDQSNCPGTRRTLRRLLSWLLISMLVGITLFWLGMMIVFFINFW
jgi:hypothetical protein